MICCTNKHINEFESKQIRPNSMENDAMARERKKSYITKREGKKLQSTIKLNVILCCCFYCIDSHLRFSHLLYAFCSLFGFPFLSFMRVGYCFHLCYMICYESRYFSGIPIIARRCFNLLLK